MDEKNETPYWCGESRWVAPTVIASSALPGSLIVTSSPAAVVLSPEKSWFQPYPVLPADTTTTTPVATSWLTSLHSGLCPQANHSGSNG